MVDTDDIDAQIAYLKSLTALEFVYYRMDFLWSIRKESPRAFLLWRRMYKLWAIAHCVKSRMANPTRDDRAYTLSCFNRSNRNIVRKHFWEKA